MTAVVPPAEPRASTDQKTRDLTREEPDERPMGLARISQSGTPPHNDIKTIAILLLRMCGLILVLILVMATWVAWFQPGSLKDVIGFFATVVATLGTLFVSLAPATRFGALHAAELIFAIQAVVAAAIAIGSRGLRAGQA